MCNYTSSGGRVMRTLCNALSERTQQMCKALAVKGKTKFRFHGGAKTVVVQKFTAERSERNVQNAVLNWLN